MGIPLWLLWIASVVSATWNWSWRWSRPWGLSCAFGQAWEFLSLGEDVAEHTDPWTKAPCRNCWSYPVVTMYYRIRLWPPTFIDKPIIDMFTAYDCNDARARLKQDLPPLRKMVNHMWAKQPGEPFVAAQVISSYVNG